MAPNTYTPSLHGSLSFIYFFVAVVVVVVLFFSFFTLRFRDELYFFVVVLLPQALKLSMNFNISKATYYNVVHISHIPCIQ